MMSELNEKNNSVNMVETNQINTANITFENNDNSSVKRAKKRIKFDLNSIYFPENTIYLVSFTLPIIILIALYFGRGIFPFGDKCYLRSDMYHQYLPFFSSLWYKIRDFRNITYASDIGLGVNYVALYAYYLSSPINWLIFIAPHKYLIEAMSIIIILKSSLASLSFSYFYVKRFNNKNPYAAFFGVFYGLSGYLAAYNWNIMWLDCVLIFPLIVLGLYRLVTEKKCYLYCLALGFAILSNYYIAIMICLTMILYYIFLIIKYPAKSAKEFFITFKNFACYSLLAGGLAAVLLIPELFAFFYSVSSNISFPKELTQYFSILRMLTRHLMYVPVHLGLEHYPNIYCSVAVFLLFPLYICNKRISTVEKAGKSILLLIMLLGFNFNIPNFVWHGFHFPNSLPARQSFIYIFILLSMCADAFIDIKEYSKQQLATALWVALGFLLISDAFLLEKKLLDFKAVYISGLFILLYMLVIYLYKSKAVPFVVFILFASLLPSIECVLNYEGTSLSTTDRTYYLKDNDDIMTLVDTAKSLEDKNSIFRIERYLGLRTKNDGAWYDYPSVSLFSSTANGGLSEIYKDLGMESSTNAYSYAGSTCFTSALLRTKYLLSNEMLKEDTLISYVDDKNGSYLYQNNYILPVGFMLSETFEDDWNNNNSNPFVVQNSFIQTACGVDNVFVKVNNTPLTSSSVKIETPRTQRIYFKVLSSDINEINVYINDNVTTKEIRHNHIIDLGIINANDDVRVTINDTTKTLALHSYTVNETAFIEAINKMSKNALNVTEYTGTKLTGTITSEFDGNMFLSIPYDNSWTIKVDGEKIENNNLMKAFLLVPVTKGTHTITMSYVPEGLILGMVITITCVIMLVVIRFVPNIELTKKNTEEE